MNQKILIGIIAAIVLVAGAIVVLHHHKAVCSFQRFRGNKRSC